MKIVYLRSYGAHGSSVDRIVTSDAIGYGATSGRVLVAGMRSAGHDVIVLPTKPADSRVRWVLDTYRELYEMCELTPPDLVFIFHILHQFPVEVRRCLVELGLDVPIAGYSHGSHWDSTDAFRHRHFPGLAYADLANLLTLDAILCASETFRRTLVEQVRTFSPAAGARVDEQSVTVGLPIDTEAIDRHRAVRCEPHAPRIVFNHSLVPEKGVHAFVEAAHTLLSRHAHLSIVITRDPDGAHPRICDDVLHLRDRWTDRVLLGHDLPVDRYYGELARASHQVSTAAHDSFGIATVEAMYARCCTILSKLPAYEELFREDPGAAVFHDGSADGIVAAYERTCDPPARRCLGDRQRNTAQRFTAEQVAARILDRVTAGRDVAAVTTRRRDMPL